MTQGRVSRMIAVVDGVAIILLVVGKSTRWELASYLGISVYLAQESHVFDQQCNQSPNRT